MGAVVEGRGAYGWWGLGAAEGQQQWGWECASAADSVTWTLMHECRTVSCDAA
jgi:hypothetical protein